MIKKTNKKPMLENTIYNIKSARIPAILNRYKTVVVNSLILKGNFLLKPTYVVTSLTKMSYSISTWFDWKDDLNKKKTPEKKDKILNKNKLISSREKNIRKALKEKEKRDNLLQKKNNKKWYQNSEGIALNRPEKTLKKNEKRLKKARKEKFDFKFKETIEYNVFLFVKKDWILKDLLSKIIKEIILKMKLYDNEFDKNSKIMLNDKSQIVYNIYFINNRNPTDLEKIKDNKNDYKKIKMDPKDIIILENIYVTLYKQLKVNTYDGYTFDTYIEKIYDKRLKERIKSDIDKLLSQISRFKYCVKSYTIEEFTDFLKKRKTKVLFNKMMFEIILPKPENILFNVKEITPLKSTKNILKFSMNVVGEINENDLISMFQKKIGTILVDDYQRTIDEILKSIQMKEIKTDD